MATDTNTLVTAGVHQRVDPRRLEAHASDAEVSTYGSIRQWDSEQSLWACASLLLRLPTHSTTTIASVAKHESKVTRNAIAHARMEMVPSYASRRRLDPEMP
jgi:hypothetical protein